MAQPSIEMLDASRAFKISSERSELFLSCNRQQAREM